MDREKARPSVFLPFCLPSRPLVGSSFIVFWFVLPLFPSGKVSRSVCVLVFSTERTLHTLLCNWPLLASSHLLEATSCPVLSPSLTFPAATQPSTERVLHSSVSQGPVLGYRASFQWCCSHCSVHLHFHAVSRVTSGQIPADGIAEPQSFSGTPGFLRSVPVHKSLIIFFLK